MFIHPYFSFPLHQAGVGGPYSKLCKIWLSFNFAQLSLSSNRFEIFLVDKAILTVRWIWPRRSSHHHLLHLLLLKTQSSENPSSTFLLHFRQTRNYSPKIQLLIVFLIISTSKKTNPFSLQVSYLVHTATDIDIVKRKFQ